MEFTVEDLSPVKKKVSITVAPEEVNASLASAAAEIKNNVQMDGFRKGKVPVSVIEKRFKNEVQKEAHESLISVHINEISQKIGKKPLSGVMMQGENADFVKGEPFKYSMEFEVAPDFELPVYEGLEVEEVKVDPSPKVIDQIINRFLKGHAKLVPVDGSEPVKNGQIANVDFEILENGQPKPDFSATSFDVEIGAQQALEDFEKLVMTIPVGHTSEGDVTFPSDFIAEDLAGKTLRMRVTVHAVKERQIPELTDALAKNYGYADVADMRQKMEKIYVTTMSNLHKAEAQQKLLEQILKQVDFELPPSFVNSETSFLVYDYLDRMERAGKNAAPDKAALDKLKEEYKPSGEEHARQKLLLLAIADKENLEISSEEVLREIYNGSQKLGVDFKDYYQKMNETGLIFQLKDNMLCDKAMDIVYERAKIDYIDDKEETVDEKNESASTEDSPKAEKADSNN